MWEKSHRNIVTGYGYNLVSHLTVFYPGDFPIDSLNDSYISGHNV